jgi:hypothetical protein
MKAYIALAIALVLLGVVIKSNFSLRGEISALKDSITAYNKAEQKSIKTITKIREVIKNVQEPCDCYNQPMPDDVIKLLRD